MVDRARAYRRWALRRLGALGALFAAALVANAWIAVGTRASAAVKVACLSLAGLALGIVGWLFLQTFACAARKSARAVRLNLSPWRPVALASAVLLLAVVLIPSILQDPETAPASPRRRAAFRHTFPPAPERVDPAVFEQVPPAALAAAEPEPPAATEPQVLPVFPGVPRRMDLSDRDLGVLSDAAPGVDLPSPMAQERGPIVEPDLPPMRPDADAPFRPVVHLLSLLGDVRLGVPDESDPDGRPSPSVRFEAAYFPDEERTGGGGVGVVFDLPLGAADSFRATILAVMLGEKLEDLEDGVDQAWQRISLDYSVRLVGFTRQSTFDLAVGAGVVTDRFTGNGLEGHAYVSPGIWVEAGVWTSGPVGFLFHAGQSIAPGYAEHGPAVTELLAWVKVDLTVSLSLHAGFRWILIQVRDPDDDTLGKADWDRTLSGPTVGLEIRF